MKYQHHEFSPERAAWFLDNNQFDRVEFKDEEDGGGFLAIKGESRHRVIIDSEEWETPFIYINKARERAGLWLLTEENAYPDKGLKIDEGALKNLFKYT